jgi:DNA polymerase III subunit epsilon
MAGILTDDEQYQATTFHVIDFETTTPKGHRPEPIEVAVTSLAVRQGKLTETARFTELMSPPPHAPVTAFDTGQTGITPAMVAGKPPAAEVLATLDALLTAPGPALLVAHSAPVEASLLYDYREHCPRLARTALLDTIKLARVVYPHLPSHGLDTLMTALDIPRPADRHRAMADVTVTVDLFRRLMTAGAEAGHWHTLREARKHAGYEPRAAMPQQDTLF